MSLTELLCYCAALPPLGLAVYALIREARTPVRRFLVAGCIALSFETIFSGLMAGSLLLNDLLRWQTARLMVMVITPWPWFLFSLTYSRGNAREFLRRWTLPVVAAAAVMAGVTALFYGRLIVAAEPALEGEWVLKLGRPALAVYAVYLLGLIGTLTNLERTLRASTGTMRWRIKYAILGLATVLIGRIYVASQTLLYADVNVTLFSVEAAALFLGALIFLFALSRGHLQAVDLYLSQRAIFNSLTFLATGAYLVLVGVAAKVAYLLQSDVDFPLVALVILLSLVALAILLMSDRIRLRVNALVSTHFLRPRHDFRALWMTLTRDTASRLDSPQYCRAAVRFVADTLDVLSVSIWLSEDRGRTVRLGGSTLLTGEDARRLLAGESRGLGEAMEALATAEYPLNIEKVAEPWAAHLRLLNPDKFGKGGGRMGVLLRAGSEDVGILVVGDRISGVPFTTEDLLLLQAIAAHVAAGLQNIRLSEQLMAAKELEAFETMSAFLVHDLKNTASTLSLVLENMPEHYDDPGFRHDALQAVTRSVGKVNDVIRRLTALRHKGGLMLRNTPLGEMTREALAGMERAQKVRLDLRLAEVPVIRADPEELQKVVENLVLNAIDASAEGATVRVETRAMPDHVVLEVADTGCGMDADYIEKSLFRPFKTTKKNGMGIGLYQCRKIVEAHGGAITVESEVGRGSVFRVLLPLKNP